MNILFSMFVAPMNILFSMFLAPMMVQTRAETSASD